MDDIPYCGPAPVPAALWSQWNLDPWLIGALLIGIAGHAALVLSDRSAGRSTRLLMLAAGWAILFALFVSPLCALTSALFSARVTHHVAMVAVAAPLLVLALPPSLRNFSAGATVTGCIVLAHAVLMWLWHAPAPYAAALASHALFWIMEATLLGSALLVWLVALSPRAGLGPAMTALLGTFMQMGFLGAVITFAGAPLYEQHLGATAPWGLTALADQQLAGLIMWVPAALPYLVAALAIAASRLGRIALAETGPARPPA